MCRLSLDEAVCLQRGDKVTVVVHASPPTSWLDQISHATKSRRTLLGSFGKAVLIACPCSLVSREKRNQFITRKFAWRTIHQAGKPFLEFNVRVMNYPERLLLALPSPLSVDINHWFGVGQVGLNLEVIGCGTAEAGFQLMQLICSTFKM